MDASILIGGFGGQGVQTLGKLLAYAANDADQYVTFYPAYGGEMRGGTSNCTVVISDRKIGAPARNLCDYVLALNSPSSKRFESRVKPGGVMIVNSSLVKDLPTRTDIQVIQLPINDLAAEMGNMRAANVILYGFFTSYSQVVAEDSARNTLKERLGRNESYAQMNDQAFLKGKALADNIKN
jgi:2-oxoglutarate ferredoxin oxidoreductase subunit gamma